MKYAVCAGNTVNYGVANKGVVEVQTFAAGDLVSITDKKELARLVNAGVIRPLESTPDPDGEETQGE